MKIVFFSHYFPPEVNAPASRTYEHCRHWVAAGHDVTVVTCVPNHPAGKAYHGYDNRRIQRETIDGIKIVRVWTWLAANAGFFRRIANYVSYMLSALSALPHIDRPDVIISTSPQFFCGLTGWGAKLFWRRPWVLEVRDLWPESIVTVGAMRRESVAVSALEWLETNAYRNADQIVSVTDAFVAHIAARTGRRDVVKTIKNGVNLSQFDPNLTSRKEAKERFGLEGKFVAAYVGTHGMAHGLETILQAAKLLVHRDDICFLMVGDGAARAHLEVQACEMGLGNVRILGQLPKTAMPDIWAATDVSLIHLKRSDTFKKVLPSKMFEAMAMERPIVLGIEGEALDLINKAGAGLPVTPENASEMAAAVTRLADNAYLAEQFGRAGGCFVRAYFDRCHLANDYLNLLQAIVSPRRVVKQHDESAPSRIVS